MAKLRPNEEWVRRIVEQHVGRTVDAHDDGSEDSMYDLRVGPVDAPEIAIEITGAIDEAWMSTWFAAQGRSGEVAGMDGDWSFELRRDANVKRLIGELPGLVAAIGAESLATVHEEDLYLRPELRCQFERLGVTMAYRQGWPGTGKVFFSVESGGYADQLDSLGRTVPCWIGEYLAQPKRADNLRKVAASGAPQREVFVIADLAGTPWGRHVVPN